MLNPDKFIADIFYVNDKCEGKYMASIYSILLVQDDGRGFESESGSGYGLGNMKYRAEEIGEFLR